MAIIMSVVVNSWCYGRDSSAGFPYMIDRLKPRASKFRDPPVKCIIFLKLLLNFHTYAVITYCTFKTTLQ